MLTLSLLRHAKSAWDDPTLDDFERPLAKRGVTAARKVGAYLAREGLCPRLVLCSGAVRTRATLALLLAGHDGNTPELIYDDALYLALPAMLLGRVRAFEPSVLHAMLIGHNPGMHALALELTGGGTRDDVEALATKFPTAALAVLTFEADRWSGVKPAAGRLERFVMPRTLGSRE